MNKTGRLKQVMKWIIAAVIWAIPLLSFRTTRVSQASWVGAYVLLTVFALIAFYDRKEDRDRRAFLQERVKDSETDDERQINLRLRNAADEEARRKAQDLQAIVGMIVLLGSLLVIAVYGASCFLQYGLNSDFGYIHEAFPIATTTDRGAGRAVPWGGSCCRSASRATGWSSWWWWRGKRRSKLWGKLWGLSTNLQTAQS